MQSVEEWAEIRRLQGAEGLSIKAIARRVGLARNPVRAAVRRGTPPQYQRAPRGSLVDVVEPAIQELLRAHTDLPATVIAERLGWTHGPTVLRARVAELRPVYQPPAPYQRSSYAPGELVQWDLWWPEGELPVGYGQSTRLPVLVGVAGCSRYLVARMIPSREAPDVLGGHLACLQDLGGVPRLGVYDNEPAIGRRHGPQQAFSALFQRFRGALGMGAYLLRPRHPEGKGLVERANGYLETSFLPGRAFASRDDFNSQLRNWLARANQRCRGS